MTPMQRVYLKKINGLSVMDAFVWLSQRKWPGIFYVINPSGHRKKLKMQ